MNRKRGLISDIFKLKKRRTEADKFGVKSDEGAPTDIRGSLEYLMTLFPRKLFNDALPQIVLKHQLYSIHRDKTLVDKEVNKMREDGELLMFQLGFDAEAFALVFTSDYKAKVSAAEEGRDTRATVGRFLEKLSSPCTDLSFDKDRMITEFLFADAEITQLVKAGVLTVRDAGSWWLSIPNSGRFTKYFIQGRKGVLAMVKKARYGEVLRAELEGRRTPSHVKFHIKYLVHDLVGAELVDSIPTTSGTLLRFVGS
ncbi:inactive serine/threonine-protein kinase 19-like isoform X2 [Syngnathoides biaculeatus]|uniref:inactive serine/threonine-protein kinase 19-like isoform X2 n=1 Tax=Syngnathoides biaculeatus TaxID=300417 RepID=UPI002ADDD268|nr:inactive serine/threonine-protein kinase 19-like isoform X2 [Syngnathoides biaculeatus]